MMKNLLLPLFAVMLLSHSASNAASLVALIVDKNGNPVENAVVTATPVDSSLIPAIEAPRDEVDQIDKDFVPHVKVVMKGSRVFFPNKDDIRHHVYSFSPAKVFELPLYTGTPSEPVIFDTQGEVTLGCNIHDWMLGYIFVVDSPWYGKSDTTGKALIRNLPAGEYHLRMWHPNLRGSKESTEQIATVGENAPTQISWQIDLKPVFRIPRASAGSGGIY